MIRTSKQEIPWIHMVRVVACVMVVMLHALPPLGEMAIKGFDRLFYQVVFVYTRPCVPLFFMITGFLILPYKEDNPLMFYKKRIPRVFFPLMIWGIIYAILPWVLGMYDYKEMMMELILSPIKPPGLIGGILWYLFILIGVYLAIPFFNKEIYHNKKMVEFFLLIWMVSSIAVVLRSWYPDLLGMVIIHNVDLTLYFSGYLGFVFLGLYLKEYESPIQSGGAFCMYIILFVVTILLPAISNKFLSFGAVIMTFCTFVLLSQVKVNSNSQIYRLIKTISRYSFGIYLSQMLIYRLFTYNLYLLYGTTWWIQIIVMLSTFVLTLFLVKLLSLVPNSKYIIGC